MSIGKAFCGVCGSSSDSNGGTSGRGCYACFGAKKGEGAAMSFIDDLRADLKTMTDRMDKEDQFPEFVLATPDLKRFAEWFELAKKKTFEGRCDGYRVIEDKAAPWPFVMIPAKMLEAPKTMMKEATNGG